MNSVLVYAFCAFRSLVHCKNVLPVHPKQVRAARNRPFSMPFAKPFASAVYMALNRSRMELSVVWLYQLYELRTNLYACRYNIGNFHEDSFFLCSSHFY